MDKMDHEGAVGADRKLGLHCARLNGRQVVVSFKSWENGGLIRSGVFFIHVPQYFSYSSVDGHLGCFCFLAMVNSAAMNTGVHIFF